MMKKLLTLSFILFFTLFTTVPASAAYISSHSFLNGQADTGLLYGPFIPTSAADAIPAAAAAPSKADAAKAPVARSGADLLANVLKMVPETLTYHIKPGDSLYVIASTFGTDIEKLKQLNNIVNPHLLRVGQEIQVPNIARQEINTNMQIKQVMNADLTAYTAGPESTGKSPGDPAYGVTASGAYVKDHHTIAVDPSIIPMGSKVYIEGIGIRVAEDTGGAIKGNRIDVYMSDLPTAIQFGYKKNIKVYVLEEPKASA